MWGDTAECPKNEKCWQNIQITLIAFERHAYPCSMNALYVIAEIYFRYNCCTFLHTFISCKLTIHTFHVVMSDSHLIYHNCTRFSVFKEHKFDSDTHPLSHLLVRSLSWWSGGHQQGCRRVGSHKRSVTCSLSSRDPITALNSLSVISLTHD